MVAHARTCGTSRRACEQDYNVEAIPYFARDGRPLGPRPCIGDLRTVRRPALDFLGAAAPYDPYVQCRCDELERASGLGYWNIGEERRPEDHFGGCYVWLHISGPIRAVQPAGTRGDLVAPEPRVSMRFLTPCAGSGSLALRRRRRSWTLRQTTPRGPTTPILSMSCPRQRFCQSLRARMSEGDSALDQASAVSQCSMPPRLLRTGWLPLPTALRGWLRILRRRIVVQANLRTVAMIRHLPDHLAECRTPTEVPALVHLVTDIRDRPKGSGGHVFGSSVSSLFWPAPRRCFRHASAGRPKPDR